MGPRLLSIFKEVVVFLEVHARHTIEEIALQSQGDGGSGRLFDGVACLRNIDALYGLAIDLAICRMDTQGGNQPVG